MPILRVSLLVLVTCLVAAAPGHAKGKLFYEDTLPATGAGTVSVTVRASAAFRVVLRTSTQGRTRLYLLGKTALKGGPLIDTKTYACQGAAGSFYCQGSYEPLPKGTYTFRLKRDGAGPAHVELTVRW